MPSFCDKCGAEIKANNLKFCHNCGAELSVNKSITDAKTLDSGVTCPKCGKIIPFGETSCRNCGQALEDNKTAIIIGYIVAVFLGILGLIPGIYLLTRQNDKAKTQGIVIIALSLMPFICNFIFGSFTMLVLVSIVIIAIGVYLWTQDKALV